MNIIYKNSKGLYIDFANAPNMTLYNVEGLGPTELTKSTISKAYTNGEIVNNTSRGARQVILNMALHGGQGNDSIRRALYEILGDKEPGVLRYVDDDIDVSTEALAEGPAVDTWTLTPTIQVSFYCPSAYFHATQPTVINLLQTENIIENEGQSSTGVTIVTRITEDLSGLIVTNETNGHRLFVDYNFIAGDTLTITTEIGEKGAILYRDGQNIDIFHAVDYGDSWLRLERGQNILRYAQGDDITNTGLYVTVSFNALYWGV